MRFKETTNCLSTSVLAGVHYDEFSYFMTPSSNLTFIVVSIRSHGHNALRYKLVSQFRTLSQGETDRNEKVRNCLTLVCQHP